MKAVLSSFSAFSYSFLSDNRPKLALPSPSLEEIFPAKKLPSGKPARNNVKALGEAFRWFFETYDYTWDDIIKATKMYVNEYRDADYLYMQTSQYFICKQDKHRVKHSTLADYCDMILEGISTEDEHFKENVV